MTLTDQDLAPARVAGRFEAALFDFDGTIAESYHVWRRVDETFLARRGLPCPDGLGAELASRGFRAGAAWLIDRFGLDETVDEVCDEWNALGAELYLEQVRLRPGVSEYLRALKGAGVKTALVTNNDPGVIAALGSHIDRGLFDAEVYGREVRRDKRFPDIYAEGARRLGARPERALVFEDIAVGLSSAKRIGMTGVGVLSEDPHQDRDALAAAAAITIPDFQSLACA